jgi:hypothetical protein
MSVAPRAAPVPGRSTPPCSAPVLAFAALVTVPFDTSSRVVSAWRPDGYRDRATVFTVHWVDGARDCCWR